MLPVPERAKRTILHRAGIDPQLPERFVGEPVAATLSNGITLQSTVVSARGIRVSSAGAGELEVRVG